MRPSVQILLSPSATLLHNGKGPNWHFCQNELFFQRGKSLSTYFWFDFVHACLSNAAILPHKDPNGIIKPF